MLETVACRIVVKRADAPDNNGDVYTSDSLRRIAEKNPVKFEWDEKSKTLYLLSHRPLVSVGGPDETRG